MLLTDAQQIVKEMKGTWHGKFGMVLCPAHADRNPSLSIAQGRKGPMFKCHAGCEFKDIMRALRAHKIEVGTTEPDDTPAGNSASYSLSVVERIWQNARSLSGTLGQL
jgi:putative DNA primase/helicase